MSIERIEMPPSLENSFDVRATLWPSGDTARDAPKSGPADETSGKTRRDGGAAGLRRARRAIAPATAEAATVQASQEPRRGHPPDLVTGMIHDGDGRTQRIGHGEVAERDEADVRPPGGMQGRDDAQRSARGGTQDCGRRAGAAEQGRHRVSGGLAGRGVTIDELLVGFNLVPGQGIAVAAQAGAGGGMAGVSPM